jgi:prepilin-type N-terminal cleavage/methylation domain-containing protein
VTRFETPHGGRRGSQPARPTGYSLVESLLALAILGLVLGAATVAWHAHARLYALETERGHLRDAVEAVAEILAGELRGASPAGDLYALGPDRVALRSTVGFGIVCAADSTGDAWWLGRASGRFETLPRDSLLVFAEGDPATSADDRWVAAHTDAATAADTRPRCPGGRPADLRVRGDRAVPGVRAGAPVRAFRPYEYGPYRDARGRTWLGRRLRDGTMQPVAGPLRGGDGLRLEAYAASGEPAAAPHEAILLRVTLVGSANAAGKVVRESAFASVLLRNAALARDSAAGAEPGAAP